MTGKRKIFLDTNVLVYAHDPDAPAKRTRSQELIFAGLREGTGVISAQVLSEFFVTLTRKAARPLTTAQTRQEMDLLSALETVDIDATLVLRAVDLKERWQLNYWDALILAAAERAGCQAIYSEDLADGQSYGSVAVHNPY